MTYFDYEILEAVAKYGEKGVTLLELESKHFKGYEVIYNLYELSERKPLDMNGIKISIANDTVLDSRRENVKIIGGGIERCTYRYFITHRGRALLNNWQRCRHRTRVRYFVEGIGFALMGAVLGAAINYLLF